ncbi:hypothetical protein DDZ13_07635 [Coraliomargarita sinensis]|uniref:F5/8 type C domain-containing protein n=1 Tax=Coraliomargarita sinensis TaxID=2174842 RepID=A0A317ZFM8_9BACT|nr:PEP-CTERM sorting domain-containing protein [Coraliomargarita sinensis]PXA04394.1 hypothetical protein DDZ13_07635 [Coraliomargarita sinensis]
MFKKKLLTATLTPLAMIALSANAAVVIQPTDVDASSQFSPSFDSSHVIDGSGLGADSSDVETGDPVPTTWPTNINDSNTRSASWVSRDENNGWIMFDLGQSYELDGMHIWNYNSLESRGIQDVNIKFATTLTGTFGSTDETDTGWGTTTAETFTQASKLNTYTGETYSLGSTVTAQYVLFDIQTNYGDSLVGLDEVRFTGTAVPEPSSFALLASCFGLTWIMVRRR